MTEEPVREEGLGERIGRLRRAKGLRQKELASRVGANLQQISNYERGVYSPRSEVLMRLAEALDVSADYLLTGRHPYDPPVDRRLRDRVEAMEKLPRPLRDQLVELFDSILHAFQLVSRAARRPGEPAEVEPADNPGELP